MTKAKQNNTVTIPKFLFDSLIKDSALIGYLRQIRGNEWIEALRKEMELEQKYGEQPPYKLSRPIPTRSK